MRIVIFTDANTVVTARLLRSMGSLAEAGDHRLVGVVTTAPEAFASRGLSAARAKMLRAVIAAANPEFRLSELRDMRLDLFRWARRRGIPILVPSTGDPNDPNFVREMVARLRPDAALSFYSRHRFGRRLRCVFAQAVNFHDGLLPDYRGVMATSFSIFTGESRSGLTFHHMSGKIDRGPVLLQETVQIDERSTLDEVSRAKSLRAAAALPRALELMAAGDPGRPQSGEGRYFSGHDWMALTHLSQPANATAKQILRRIRAFGVVHLTIDGETYPVTRLRPARPGERRAFRTADTALLRPDRFRGLPRLYYRLDEWTRRFAR